MFHVVVTLLQGYGSMGEEEFHNIREDLFKA